MILDDVCACGHRRGDHGSSDHGSSCGAMVATPGPPMIVKSISRTSVNIDGEDIGVPNAYDFTPGQKVRMSTSTTCACNGFVRDSFAAWRPLARIIELVVAGEATVRVDRFAANGKGGRGGWRIDVDTGCADDMVAPGDACEDEQLAEFIASRWLDLSGALRDAGRPPATLPKACEVACHACGAKAGAWCVPTHAGERAVQGWTHPMRGVAVDDNEVVRWARRVNAGEQPCSLLHSPADDAIAARQLSDCIVALAADNARMRAREPLALDEPTIEQMLHAINTTSSDALDVIGGMLGVKRTSVAPRGEVETDARYRARIRTAFDTRRWSAKHMREDARSSRARLATYRDRGDRVSFGAGELIAPGTPVVLVDDDTVRPLARNVNGVALEDNTVIGVVESSRTVLGDHTCVVRLT